MLLMFRLPVPCCSRSRIARTGCTNRLPSERQAVVESVAMGEKPVAVRELITVGCRRIVEIAIDPVRVPAAVERI